jgi:hypothetical protein
MKAGSMRSSKYHHKKFRGEMKGLRNLFSLWSISRPEARSLDELGMTMREDQLMERWLVRRVGFDSISLYRHPELVEGSGLRVNLTNRSSP